MYWRLAWRNVEFLADTLVYWQPGQRVECAAGSVLVEQASPGLDYPAGRFQFPKRAPQRVVRADPPFLSHRPRSR